MRTRFAPSPTGPLHLGHAFSALTAFELAQRQDGAFLLRIEDIDQSRARPEWEERIYDDLAWLELTWEEPILRQSERLTAYDASLDQLWSLGLLYSCTCRRRDIVEAQGAPNEGELLVGPDGIVYPGTCRPDASPTGPRPRDIALRLNLSRALDVVALDQANIPNADQNACTFPTFNEKGKGPNGEHGVIELQPSAMIEGVGDVVLARKDMGTSYHLAVVVDDAFQDVTDVVRGADLFDATHIHVLLQCLLGVNTPRYHHHRLIRDENGKRLAKRHDSKAIRLFRDQGCSPNDIRRMVGL